MTHDRTTRWLHAALAVGITGQLLLSLVMEHPEHGRPAGGLPGFAFEVHENLGMAVLLVLLLHWLWQLTGHTARGLDHLFPWFSRERRAELVADLRRTVSAGFRDLPDASPLADSVHGLGILAASAMAASGAVLYFGMGENGQMSAPVHWVAEFHGFMATFMWLYLGGHAAMAVRHQRLGHGNLSDMFNLKR